MFEKKNINRIMIVQFGFFIVITLIIAKLFWVSVIQADYYREKAQDQYEKSMTLDPKRGRIYDRNGKCLAMNRRIKSIHALNYQVTSIDSLDSIFCEIFQHEPGYYKEKIGNRFGFVSLENRIEIDIASRIMDARINGVHCIDNYRRVYPYNEIGAQVIGFTDTDNKGIAGLELYYDEILSGKPGEIIMFSDASGKRNPLLSYGGENPKNGNDIHLTIDIELQAIVEAELEKGIKENKAAGGFAVFLIPKTGEVLAMASYPGFDPNNIGNSPKIAQKNRAITDVFEPGSVFKVVTYSTAVEDSGFCVYDTIDCENGLYQTRYKTVTDAHPEGRITMKKVLVESSNVGTVKIAERLDNNLLYNRARRFGFGSSTGIDFVGEVGGRLPHQADWSSTTPYVFPIGYEVSVTPLQVACAYGAIANGGKLMKPYLTRKIIDRHGNLKQRYNPIEVRRVMEERTDSILIEALTEVVDSGTARKAKIEGVKMAGKTGTAVKLNPDGPGYWAGHYIATFTGFAPANDAQIVGIISIDDPRNGIYYGGSVAGPVFKNILEKASNSGIIDIWKVDYTNLDTDAEDVIVPDLYRMKRNQAEKVLHDRGLKADFFGNGYIVFSQSPNPLAKIDEGGTVRVGLARNPIDLDDSIATVPNIYGITMREAISKLNSEDIKFRIIGSGTVEETDPKPGQAIKPGDICLVVCK
ncbi:MAG: penicillin-binding transpeptidase domain-containing protein [Candidatus Zixiibacteriota bacterium]